MEQKKESKNNFCAAAKRYPTKGKAFEAFNTDAGKNGVYLVEEIVNGVIKHIPYGRCCNSVQDNELCHIHDNQKKKEKSGFLYFEKDIKSKCDNVKIKKANINMSYFKQMGDRGRNKASKTTFHDFKNEDDPILKIIKIDKNPRLLKDLKLYAIQLLNTQNIAVKAEKEDVKEETDNISKNKELLETIQRLNIDYEKNQKEIKNDSIETEIDSLIKEEVDDNDINKNTKIEIEKESENKINDSDDEISDKITSDDEFEEQIISQSENDDDDDGYEVSEIYTNNGRLLYLLSDSISVIEPEGDDSGECIGVLHEISKKFSTIQKDNKFYTVISNTNIFHNDDKYFRDVLNNRIFDQDFNFKGRVTMVGNSKQYKFHFD